MMLDKAFSRILLLTLILGLSAGIASRADAQTSPQEAAQFVETLGNEAVGLLASAEARQPGQRHAILRDLIRRGFNLELTSQFVLGKFWNQASVDQRTEFKELFAEYLLNSYARHLGSYRAETLTIVDANPIGEMDVLVETSIRSAGGSTNPVWRVRGQEGIYKIIDVSVDGVSLALTQRREFASVVNRSGLDGLLRVLREKLEAQAKATQNETGNGRSPASLLASILASPNANMIGIFLAQR